MTATVGSNVNKPAIVLLGAGLPVQGEVPSALHQTIDQKSVLDWINEACSGLDANWHFIGGYHLEEIKKAYPHIQYSTNRNWQKTGSCASLLVAPLNDQVVHYVSYTDIVYNHLVVDELREATGDVVIAVDSLWRDRYDRRTNTDIIASEKVCVINGRVDEIGIKMDVQKANAEFIGLVKFSPKAMAFLLGAKNKISSELKKSQLSELISLFINSNLSIRTVDVRGQWAELNAPQDLARFVLGTKAETLARLRPMVHLSKIGDQISFSFEDWRSARQPIVEKIQSTFKNQKLAIRSSALSEDGWYNSNAGAYLSLLNISSGDPSVLSENIERVANSYPDKNPHNQILIQKMVSNIKISGVALTRTINTGAPYYVINYDSKSKRSDTVTSGLGSQLQTMIICRSTEVLPEGTDPGFLKLLSALKELEQLVGYDALDVEFILSENDVVNILQLRPIAVDHTRWKTSDFEIESALKAAQKQFLSYQAPTGNIVGKQAVFGVMPDWNPAEIIGTKPKPLALCLYRDLISDDVWAIQRSEYGYRDVRPHALITAFVGHPYVDIRASFNSFIPKNIDEKLANRLVDHFLDALKCNPQFHDKVEFDILYTCWSFDFTERAQSLRKNGISDTEILKFEKELKRITRNGIDRLDQDLNKLAILSSRREKLLSTKTSALDKAIQLIDDCREFGTLPFAHLARAGFVAMTLLRSAVASSLLKPERQTMFMNSLNTVAKQFSQDGKAVKLSKMKRSDYFSKYGHLRPGTYDVSSARYDTDPDNYFEPIIMSSAIENSEPIEFTWTEHERQLLEHELNEAQLNLSAAQLEDFMRKAIEGREYSKFLFTRNLSDALEEIAIWGQEFNLTRDQVSHLDLETIRSFVNQPYSDEGEKYLTDRSNLGYAQRLLIESIELPPLLFDVQDFTSFHHPDSYPNFITIKSIVAPVVHLNSDNNFGQDVTGSIVFIEQADPGYDWLFGQNIAGLITKYGGVNSHMAIRAAEFDLPAAIGIGEKEYERLRHTRSLELNCNARKLNVLQ